MASIQLVFVLVLSLCVCVCVCMSVDPGVSLIRSCFPFLSFILSFFLPSFLPPSSPFNNPAVTYRYYSLPFCHVHSSEEEEEEEAEEENLSIARRASEKRQGALSHRQRLGESIVGDRRETSPYEISFLDDVEWRLLCKKTFELDDLQKFKDAIHNNYFFEMFVEDLPMWGYIGDIEDEDILIGEVEGQSKTYLFPHLHFKLGHNSGQIVSAKVTTDVSR